MTAPAEDPRDRLDMPDRPVHPPIRPAVGRQRATEAEDIARRFHQTYERLAPSFGYETRLESAVPWEDAPEQNRRLMVAVTGEVLADLLAEVRRGRALREAVNGLADGAASAADLPVLKGDRFDAGVAATYRSCADRLRELLAAVDQS